MNKLALFDFDETLIQENSLGFLFKKITQRNSLWSLVLPLALKLKTYQLGIKLSIKTYLYAYCLEGTNEHQLFQIGQQVAEQLTPITEVVESLLTQHQQGISVWLVTAAPRPFIEGVIDTWQWPVDKVVGTELRVQGDHYSGQLIDECVGEQKVKRLKQIFADNSPSIEIAYGNLPVDKPMLLLAKKRFAVKRGEVLSLQ